MIKFWIYLLTIFQILVKVKEVRRMTAIASNEGKASNKTTGPQSVKIKIEKEKFNINSFVIQYISIYLLFIIRL